MTPPRYEYCKVFVNEVDPDRVASIAAASVGGPPDRCLIELEGIVLEVRPNADAGWVSDFLGWPITIEVEAADGTVSEPAVSTVTALLQALWNAETPAVAACDYEDELPHRGGINLTT